MSFQRISERYARAFFEVAEKENILEAARNDMEQLLQLIGACRPFALFIASQVLSDVQKASICHKIFEGRVHELTLRFILLMARKGRAALLATLPKAFLLRYADYKGLVEAELLTATPIDSSLQEELKGYVSRLTAKRPLLKIKQRDALIGGFVLRVGDRELDRSVWGQLNHFERRLKDAAVG